MPVVQGERHVASYGVRDFYVTDDLGELVVRAGTDGVDRYPIVEALEVGDIMRRIAEKAIRQRAHAEMQRPPANVPPSDSSVGSPA